jgi:transcriptional regulator with XRE-family HTH domain
MDAIAVRAIRLQCGETQAEFAARLGVSRSLVAAVECELRAVSLQLRIKIAQLVGVGDEVIEAIDRARYSNRLA